MRLPVNGSLNCQPLVILKQPRRALHDLIQPQALLQLQRKASPLALRNLPLLLAPLRHRLPNSTRPHAPLRRPSSSLLPLLIVVLVDLAELPLDKVVGVDDIFGPRRRFVLIFELKIAILILSLLQIHLATAIALSRSSGATESGTAASLAGAGSLLLLLVPGAAEEGFLFGGGERQLTRRHPTNQRTRDSLRSTLLALRSGATSMQLILVQGCRARILLIQTALALLEQPWLPAPAAARCLLLASLARQLREVGFLQL